ncbi:hypothetical protein ACLOJK_025769 [Asimina triloba]
MNVLQSLAERLRPLVGLKGWDYCVTVRTRLLIPVGGGLVELFVAKHVHEDEHIVEFVMAQCNHPWDQESMIDFPGDQSLINNREIESPPIDYDSKSNTTHFQHWLSPPTDNLNLAWDLSPTPNAFAPDGTSTLTNPLFFEGSTDSILSDKPAAAGIDHGFPDIVSLHQSLRNAPPNLHHPSIAESSATQDAGHHDKESIKHEVGRGDSVSDCSDQVEDDDDHKALGRSGRRHQSKNLMAERKRRKKLNDRLYALRALVPKITKMDRASILGDAIEFVKELQKQVKDLQDELEEETTPPPPPQPEEEEDDGSGGKQSGINNKNNNSESSQQKVVVSGGDGESPHGLRMEITDHGTRCSSSTKTAHPIKENHEQPDKAQQMEPQVEVSQVEGNGFFLKVFCEYRSGGFVRLMEAMNALGLEVTNANVTTFRTLVLNVFKVQKRDSEVVQAHQVRDSLLEITRNPNGILMWADSGGNIKADINNNGESSIEHQQQHHHRTGTRINLHHLQHFTHS